MTPEEKELHTYLGDGVYAQLTPSHIVLRTGSHKDEDCDNKIYFEAEIIAAFLYWLEQMFIKNEKSVLNYVPLNSFYNDLKEKKERYMEEKLKSTVCDNNMLSD